MAGATISAVSSLASLPWWLLFPGLVLTALAVAFGIRPIVRHVLGHGADHAGLVAASLTTAFGALFAFLSAFLITTEWSQHSAAESAIAAEAASVARLAWSADAPGVDQALVLADLEAYLDSTTADWSAMADGRTSPLASDADYRRVQVDVRAQAALPGVPTASASEMLAALDAVAGARRERLSAAARQLPTAIVVVVVVSGLALVVNSVILAAGRSRRAAGPIAAIAIVVGLDLALVFMVSSPFRGTLIAEPTPLERVATEMRTGWFGPL